jgi:hypothetical protein
MISKLLLASIASLAIISSASAQQVDLTAFTNTPSEQQPFTLRVPQPVASEVAPTVDGLGDLAKDFTALRPARPLQPAIATAANGGFPKALDTRHRVEPFHPRIEADSFMGPCGAAPYMPNPQIPPEAEQRRAVWYPPWQKQPAMPACRPASLTPSSSGKPVQSSRRQPEEHAVAQLMPSNARVLGVHNIWDPRENMRGGARYLRSLLDEFGRFDLALAAYNAGAGRVRTKHQVPRIAETIHYVSGILMTMRRQLAPTMADKE